MITKVKENLILNIKSEFVNGSDIPEWIYKGEILYLRKEILIKRILKESYPIRAESENESFKAMRNIQIENNMKREKKLEENVKKVYAMIFKEFYPS